MFFFSLIIYTVLLLFNLMKFIYKAFVNKISSLSITGENSQKDKK